MWVRVWSLALSGIKGERSIENRAVGQLRLMGN